MNFHEPDLEDLIQSDLHKEMNKILDQSEGCDVSIKSTTSASSSPTESKKTATVHSSTGNKNSRSTNAASSETTVKHNSLKSNENSEENVESILDNFSSKTDSFQVKSEPSSELTYRSQFSNENLPAVADEVKPEQSVPETPEVGDLSNLAWLTGLDVQQTLQQSEMAESNAHLADISVVTNSSCLPVTNACVSEANAVPYECMPLKPHIEAVNQTMKKQPMRFTPIQPNIPFEDCQRYHLHPGETIHRKLFPSEHIPEHRYGMHRGFHPYPPPPYGSAGAMYMPDNFHHGRLHTQGKKVFPKPVYSYSCLISMSLRASKTGCLPVSDIYNFMMENFPYFKTAPDGWKNSVRHNLSLNKCFEKVEKPNGSQRKGCLWALNPAKISKMEEEVQKWKRKDPEAIRRSMSNPEELDRELEEIRRSDEDAARRRMLSMNTHGLSMMTPPPPGYNPYVRPPNPHQQHPNLHPSGTASLPTTPQHYHQQRTPQRLSVMQNQSLSSGQAGLMDEHGRSGHPPRQLFNYPPTEQQQHNFAYGISGVNSTPNPGLDPGSSQHHDLQMLTSFSSNSSSGACSLLGTLTDTFAKSVHELNDIDLDSSLADLSALQGGLWDDSDPALLSHPLASEMEAFDEGISQRTPHLHSNIASSSSVSAMEQCPRSEEPASESSVFDTPSHFRGDMSYLNGSNSKAVVH